MTPTNSAHRLRLSSALILGLLAAGPAAAQKGMFAQAEFGDDFFRRDRGSKLDLSRFRDGNPLAPGSYRVDVYTNGGWIGRHDISVKSPEGETEPRACFNMDLLDAVGVNLGKLDAETLARIKAATLEDCLQLESLIDDAKVVFDGGDLRMDLSIPQIAMRRSARGYVSPELWDKGVTAGMLGYNFNAYRSALAENSSTSYYLGLNAGLNLGDWHLRNTSSVTRQSDGRNRYQTIASYAQRSIVSLKSQMTVGDFYTSGQLFDSISYRGIQLASDPRMLPESQTGFAPVVRGVARSNAKVRITQRGNVIYETTVPPGQFEITDLHPTGFGGDLRVVVTEADGSSSSFNVPFSSVAQMLRPGRERYNLVAGRTRTNGLGIPTSFVQGTYERGVSNTLTLFGGGMAAKDYLALLGGGAVNTPIGAMSASMTRSQARVTDSDSRVGQSYRVDYSSFIERTDTSLTLAAYRYSSSGYLRLQDLQAQKQLAAQGRDLARQDRQRSQLQLSLTQRLSDRYGSLYFSGSTHNYWNRSGAGVQYQFGYSNTWGVASYNVSATRQRDLRSGQSGTQVFFSVSLPLGREVNSPSLSSSMTRDSRSGSNMQTSLSGTAGEDNAFSYGATVGRSPGSTSTSVNANYRLPYASVGGSYGYAPGGTRQMSVQASGAVVAHAGGVILSQYLGDTIGIVEAKGAGGATLNSSGVRINDRGYGVIPYLTPYRSNEVVLDPKGTSTDVEMKVTSQRVAPYAGAVVLMKYATVSGRSLLIQARQPNGDPVPFGAEVLDAAGTSVGMAGQGGTIFVRLPEEQSGGMLKARWGAGGREQCLLNYALGPRPEKSGDSIGIEQVSVVCQPPSGVAGSRVPGLVKSDGDVQKSDKRS